ncbi:zinc finger protein 595-like isoform X2 [Armigeres subalbatus]|uniref:zinc finger protein 595-like isoform X2 n=1 Tax=Armigeres subalbatus TaxID=124917 RepID=UPI002ED5CB63
MKTEIDFKSICADKLSSSFTCRTCLTSDPNQRMISIFEPAEANDVLEILSILCKQISKDDGLPANICNICLDRLVAIDAFRKQCVKVHDYLVQHFVNDTKVDFKVSKIEFEDHSSDSNHSNLDPSWEPECTVKSIKQESSSDSEDDSIEDKLKCPICKKIFANIAYRRDHMLLHSDSCTYSCDQCDKAFKSGRYLRKHKKYVHEVVNHTCNICDAEFTSTPKYEYHIQTHDLVKKYPCRFCEKSFIQHTHRKTHEMTHVKKNKVRTHLCSMCGQAFFHESSLKKHLKLHEKSQKYVCHICQKEFRLKGSLKTHLTVHSNEKAYQCEHCGKNFRQAATLTKHLELHNAERPHRCEFCTESYLRIRDLRRHRLVAHNQTDITISTQDENEENVEQVCVKQEKPKRLKRPKDLPYACDLCTRAFKVPSSLASHMKVHNEDRKFVCNKCGNTFKKIEHLKLHINGVHLKMKSHSCEVCNKSFARVGDRNVHMRSHAEEKPHQCSYCGRGFHLAKALRAHTRQHTGERPFVCIICNAGFTCHKTLTSHTRKQHAGDQQVLTKVEELTQAVLSGPQSNGGAKSTASKIKTLN